MHLSRSARPARAAALLTGATLAVALTACSETRGTPVASPSAPPAAASSSDRPAAATGPEVSELRTSWDRLNLGPGVGVALVPVGGGPVTAFGDPPVMTAWSTIKVPLSIAALRNKPGNADILATVKQAIIHSDNDAALKLRRSLGGPNGAGDAATARTKVTDVLRSGGDENTDPVHIAYDSDETFGLTPWKLTDAATFAAHLPCMKNTAKVLDYMGEVDGMQQWGLKSIEIPGGSTAVKGGWGPADDGGYDVRQLGLITFSDGRQVAVTMQSHRAGEEMGVGTDRLNKVAAWLRKNLPKLPRGRC
ncbi:hypothetical protein [Gordonia sp. (in: high G+C Gram-positive bacteria)]|uniref:hypothetical protein n=1 Tax=Gordonia sp. (in: high G+C Gram-positive bacteria) TaxID=84139 RepID=UPI00352728DC